MSGRNTQAFSLIVLNQFVPEDPSEVDETAIFATGARSSAGALLTQQMNRLAARTIPGVDLTFMVESYEEFTASGPEGRTELGVELSRAVLDDRLVFRVGGQVDVEGERRRETSISDIPGSVSVEYLLREDGRYRLRAFRERAQQGLTDGSLVTTGLSFLFRYEFDRAPADNTSDYREE